MNVSTEQREDSPPVVFLAGPTAAGKTAVAVELVRRGLPDGRRFAIVSVDSAMVYRGLDIGTAKPGPEVLAVAPHRLIDIRDPAEPYSAADFRRDALAAIEVIHAAGEVPLLVGGTMLYFKALKDGLAELPPADPVVRARLRAELDEHGLAVLAARLTAIDPAAAERHAKNPQRLLRALEVHAITGRTLSELQRIDRPSAEDRDTRQDPCGDKTGSFPFRLLSLALAPPREVLTERIETRFRAMLDAGLLAEVAALRARGDLSAELPALRAVGYRQAWQYLDGQLSPEALVERGIIATRQLAKRQMTWLRSWPALRWLDAEAADPVGDALKIMALDAI